MTGSVAWFWCAGGCVLTLERPGGGETHTYTHGAVHTHKERYQVYNISMINLCTVTMCVTGVLWRISNDGKCVSALSSGGGNVGVVPSCDCLHSDQLHVDGYRFFFLSEQRESKASTLCVSLSHSVCLSVCVSERERVVLNRVKWSAP